MEEVKFCPLFSGSNGNSIFVSYKNTKILIDCGCTCKKIKENLNAIGEKIGEINAVFITHSHGDHTSALPVLLKNTNAGICATNGTLCELYNKNDEYRSVMDTFNDKIFCIEEKQTVNFFDITLQPFGVPHDAAQTVGYNITAGEKTLSILTDIGYLRENLYEDVKGRELVFLESNHDLMALENCKYTMSLKQRILSRGGHLSNKDAGVFSSYLAQNGVKRIILGHLSGEANTDELAYNTVAETLIKNNFDPEKDIKLSVSSRGKLGEVCIL